MGYYISGPTKGKGAYIQKTFGAVPVTDQEARRLLANENAAPVCVVNNGPFDAAAFVPNEEEFASFSRPDDPRPKQWYSMLRVLAEVASNYAQVGAPERPAGEDGA